ncbi:MAG: hypothetical protein VZQ83_01995 [Eubacterium sp.]|nr:hypothetical protein [Eubacterium sp.]
MKGFLRKLMGGVTLAGFALCLMVLCLTVTAEAKTKTYKSTCHVVVGSMKMIPDTDMIGTTKRTVTIKNKKIVKQVKKPVSNLTYLNPHSDYVSLYGVYVTGKKAGKTKVTVKTGKSTKYVCTVTVHKKKTVKTAAKKALNKTLQELGKTTDDKFVFFADLNGDGIDDLFVNGTMYGYNYETKQVDEAETGINMEVVDKIVVSKKNRIVYFDTTTASKAEEAGTKVAYYVDDMEVPDDTDTPDDPETPDEPATTDEPQTPDEPVATDDPQTPDDPADAEDPVDPEDPDEEEDMDDEEDAYSGYHRGLFVTFAPGEIFSTQSFIKVYKYKVPKEFVSKIDQTKEYFYFNDSSYDQDDLYYEPYTAAQLKKRINNKILPDDKQIM